MYVDAKSVVLAKQTDTKLARMVDSSPSSSQTRDLWLDI